MQKSFNYWLQNSSLLSNIKFKASNNFDIAWGWEFGKRG